MKKTNLRKSKHTLFLAIAVLLFTSCAESKDFVIDGKKVTVEPYGWFDLQSKNDSIEYRINAGNIVLDVLLCETIIVPIVLTGDQLYEPVRKKNSNISVTKKRK